MIAPNPNRICEQAKIYYYDFLVHRDWNQIPEDVLRHIRECNNCQKSIYELKTALTQAEQINHASVSSLTNMLKLHFSHIDENITCKIVKPFLPGLLDSSAQINIPTPITTHVDNCSECVRDLGKISNLKLDNAYLLRLGRLFKAESEDKNIGCQNAKSDIMAFVMMAFQESNEQVLKHLCSCGECREAIYQYRKSIRKDLLLEKRGEPCFLSSRLTNNDIFDLVVPYGINIEQYKNSEFQKSRISHIRKCPFCLNKLQELHRTVSDIVERPNSEIVTSYNIESAAESENITGSNDELYAGFPIQVEVTDAKARRRAGPIINFTSALKKKIISSNMKIISRTGFAGLLMAAVILSAMFLYSPKAKAINPDEILAAFKQENNVHISIYTDGKKNPTQEQWISRSSNIQIMKTDDQITLRDLNSKTQKTKSLNSGMIKTEPIPAELLPVYEQAIHNSLGFRSFYDLSNIPAGAEWNRVTAESQKIKGGSEVYELTYMSSGTFSDSIPIKLSFTLKAGTELPERIYLYRKKTGENDYPESSLVLEYLNDKGFEDEQNKYFGN